MVQNAFCFASIALACLLTVPRPIAARPQQGQPEGLTAEQVVANPELVHARLRAKNPEYRNQAQFAIDPVMGLMGDLSGGGVHDLSALQGIPFGALDLKGLPVEDLTPLKGMPLTFLGLEETRVYDLRPIAGMKIEKLYLSNTPIVGIEPLAGMPIRELMLVGTAVKDLRPLRKAPVQMLWLNGAPVSDITPLAGCPIMSLTLEGTNVSDLRPLSKMTSLRRLHIAGTPVSDLTPLKGLKLTRFIFSPGSIKVGLNIARDMKSLTEVGTTLEDKMPPKAFWKLYDQHRLQ